MSNKNSNQYNFIIDYAISTLIGDAVLPLSYLFPESHGHLPTTHYKETILKL